VRKQADAACCGKNLSRVVEPYVVEPYNAMCDDWTKIEAERIDYAEKQMRRSLT
jgi:hypothetical protein